MIETAKSHYVFFKVYFRLTHCYIYYDMVIIYQISKILENWQTCAFSNNTIDHINLFLLRSIDQKWIWEKHPKVVSKPPFQIF